LDERIWERSESPNEGDDIIRQRERWKFVQKYMPVSAVEVLMELQPSNSQPKKTEPLAEISILNRLSNSDRHRKITVAQRALVIDDSLSHYEFADGSSQGLRPAPTNKSRPAYPEGARVSRVPGNVVAVHLSGKVKLLFGAGDFVLDIADLRKVHNWTLRTIANLIDKMP
jgi:hypothetical protein